MKRIALAVALLLGGTSVASANPPGMTPGPIPQGMEPGPRMERDGQRMQRDGQRDGQRGRHRRLPPQLRARLLAMFDRDGDGRLQGPERRAAKQFVRTV